MAGTRPPKADQDTTAGHVGRRRLRDARRLLPLAPRQPALRITCILLALPALGVTAVALSVFDVAAREGGWLPSALAFTVPLLALTAGLGIGRRWWQRTAVVVALALALGGWIYQTSPPVPARLAAAAHEVGVPADWDLVDEQVGGSTWGLFGDFPRYDAEYATPTAAPDTLARYAALLEADGWRSYDPHPDALPSVGMLKTHWRRDRWRLSATVYPPDSPGRRDDTLGPGALTEVHIHVGYS